MQKIIEHEETRYLQRVSRGAGVEIRLGLREHRGHTFVDVRIWFRDDDGGWAPSRRGVTVPLAIWGNLFNAVVELDRALRVDGLVDDEVEGIASDHSG